MDSRFKIPGTRFTFGLDPLIGLIPFAGAAITTVIQGLLAIKMLRYGASGEVAMRMLINIVFDTFLNGVPVLGQIGDFFFKANTRNVKLLKEHYKEEKHGGSAKKIVLTFALSMLGIFILVLVGIIFLIKWLYTLLFQ